MPLEQALTAARGRMRTVLIVASAALVLCAVAWIAEGVVPFLKHHYNMRKYPPIKEKSKYGEEIMQGIETRRRQDFEAEYRRIWGLLDQAEARGSDIRYLRPKMDYAVKLARKGNYHYAFIILNTIEVRIPRRKPGFVRPAGEDDVDYKVPEPGEGRSYKGKRGRKRSRRSRRRGGGGSR